MKEPVGRYRLPNGEWSEWMPYSHMPNTELAGRASGAIPLIHAAPPSEWRSEAFRRQWAAIILSSRV
jgi:hypothetical protein